MHRINWEIRIKLYSSFHFGGSKGDISNSSAIQRDVEERPYWSGGAFKGMLRTNAMMLQEIKNGTLCTFIHGKGGDGNQCQCSVCKMFGEAGNDKGSLIFHDFIIQEPCETYYRTSNTIDRYKRVAKDNHLFAVEAAASEQMVLSGKINGFLSETDHFEQKELLEESIRFIRFVGGKISKGLGWVEHISIKELEQENHVQPNKDPSKGKYIRIKLTPKTLALIGGHSSEANFKGTQFVIPGSVLRAYMGQEIIKACGGNQGRSRINFVTKPALGEAGSPYYQLREEFTDIYIETLMPMNSRVIPMSARGCKYQDDVECTWRLYDILAVYLADSKADMNHCPSCQGRMERKTGLYRVENEELGLIRPQTVVVTKNAIGRYRRNAQDGMLYSLNLLTPYADVRSRENGKLKDKTENLFFEGAISGSFGIDEIRDLLAEEVHIGGYQTSGYGTMAVEIELSDQEEKAEIIEGIRKRIEVFNAIVSENRSTGFKENQKLYIPVTLFTDALVTLPEFTENRVCDEDYLKAYEVLFQDCVTAGLQLHIVMAQHNSWRGFDTSQKEKYLKSAAHLIQAGAVFVLTGCELTESALEALYLLQMKGICSDKEPEIYAQNGYGKIRVADEFHSMFAFRGTDK